MSLMCLETDLPPDESLFDVQDGPATISDTFRLLLLVSIGDEFVVNRRDIVDPRGEFQSAHLSIEREILDVDFACRT